MQRLLRKLIRIRPIFPAKINWPLRIPNVNHPSHKIRISTLSKEVHPN